MNDSPVSTLEQKKDRRGLLALIGAGGAAAVAALITRSNGAEAHGTLHRDGYGLDPALHGQNVGGGSGVRGDGKIGVEGSSYGGTGVLGIGETVPAEPQYGIPPEYGTGVRGEGKTGVVGRATEAKGVGVYGNAGSGAAGVRAEASGTKAALHVKGRSRFKQSGKTTVSAGAYSKVVPLAFTLAPGSLVVATLQGNAGSGVAVRTASKYGSNKIRITLTKAATKSATIAYFIFTP